MANTEKRKQTKTEGKNVIYFETLGVENTFENLGTGDAIVSNRKVERSN